MAIEKAAWAASCSLSSARWSSCCTDEPRPDRQESQAMGHALEGTLNAFQIAFEGRLTPADN
ncbi:hypothetical protein [Streptomyces sp. NPDC002889]|uniref:hypothetical protein n=1 Tax=Streptomyces sp. NPDC002889 TaxID=3364669 RepID=UPI0036A2F041